MKKGINSRRERNEEKKLRTETWERYIYREGIKENQDGKEK